ncbi:2-phosphosulfolactate phosphatase [Sediminitomix flava]|uniref:Probable 2-phosphosulfolactate phosphatase n=1 Tax=Sediminitomix flava TaxID=379075 RepID=A0A315Z751_SEDFL|nr:2-phosphosulfolactate phosphatase [Sediminitomix flava]PWJ38595.1 2-phosphosulfolactate phosphatase [Sediminitomix flava]
MRKIEVCYTPELIQLYPLEDKVVVVVDVLRATSCMVAGLANGVKEVRPVASVDAAWEIAKEGYITAGERNGVKVEGFQIGNSPFEHMEMGKSNAKIVQTTTNGTLAIDKSAYAPHVIIGAMLNVSAVAEYLKKYDHDVIIHCAGWKGKYSLEDSLFAGALLERLKSDFTIGCDAGLAALTMYNAVKDDIFGFMKTSSHVQRLGKLGVIDDIEYCLKEDIFDIVPVLENTAIVVPEQ